MKRLAKYLGLTAVVIIGGCFPGRGEQTAEQLLQEGPAVARRILSDELGVAADSLIASDPLVVTAPISGDYFLDQKFLEPRSGRVVSVPLGRRLERYDVAQLALSERSLFDGRYGKIEPALLDSVASLGSEDRVRVAVWLTVPEVPGGDRGRRLGDRDVEQLQVEVGRRRAALRQSVTGVQDSLVAAFQALGVRVSYRSRYAPVVFAELTPAQVREIAQRQAVLQMNLGRTYEEEHDSAIPTLRADLVHGVGIDGAGVGIAILENNNIAGNNPFLNVVATRDAGIANDAHAAHTAGDAASSNDTLPGVAPGADLYSAAADSYDDDDIIEAMEWAIDQGVRIINCSFGFDTDRALDALDRYFDYVVRNDWVIITKSAGNRGQTDGDVTSPGLAWNIITVGGINDGGTSDWSDDVMYASSSFGDPQSTHGDREKPEVVAVGQNVRSTTTAAPWVQAGVGGSGTSYAAPMVAGTAALLLQMNGVLGYWPEVVKAMVIAGASHNIEGTPRLSDKDGAGAIDVLRTYEMAKHGWYDGYRIEKDDFDASGNFEIPIGNVIAGRRIKAAIAWDSVPTKFSIFWFTFYFDLLAADFDLSLYDPDDNWVAGSYSWDNSFEVIDLCCAPKAGTYTLRIHRYRMDSDWEWLGVAWQK